MTRQVSLTKGDDYETTKDKDYDKMGVATCLSSEHCW